jgi:uncharacterized protein Yka (UPF0111/DUF47 family)
MAKGAKVDYFKLFIKMADSFCEIASQLHAILADFDADKLQANMTQLHKIENECDNQRHELIAALAKEFLPPIEREDILSLANELDDITDSIEDILLKTYMYNVLTIRPEAIEFASIIEKCCQKVRFVLTEFADYKRSSRIRDAIIEVNGLEEEGDRLYKEAIRGLFTADITPKELFAWTKLYSCFEKSCDVCEHVGVLVEHVILKNS